MNCTFINTPSIHTLTLPSVFLYSLHLCLPIALAFLQNTSDEFDFTNIHGILLVFSVADALSLRYAQEAKVEIEEMATRRRPQQLRFLLVGNKNDLKNDRQVTEEQCKEAAAELGCEYVEVSARYDSRLIHGAFQILLQKMRAAKKKRARRYWTSVVDQVVSTKSGSTSGMPASTSTTPLPDLGGTVPSQLTLPPTPFSSSSCDSLLSPSPPTLVSPLGGCDSPSPSATLGHVFDLGAHSIEGGGGIVPKRSSLKKSVMKRVSSFRGTGHQAGVHRPRRNSKASLEAVF